MDTASLLQKLHKIDQLARAGKFARLAHRPLDYITAMANNYVAYPIFKNVLYRKRKTFFETEMHLALPSATDIFLTGAKTHPSELRLAKYLIQNLKNGDTFWDIGAHYGYFSLLAAKIVGAQGKTLSLEAGATTFAILKANMRQTPNAKVLQMAASIDDKSVTFYQLPNKYAEYNSTDVAQYSHHTWFQQLNVQPEQVAATSLDSLLKSRNEVPDMIKIDVEGGEADVIAGAKELLTSYEPIVIMEYLAEERDNTAHQSAAALLAAAGYKMHCITDDGKLQALTEIAEYLRSVGLLSDNIVFMK